MRYSQEVHVCALGCAAAVLTWSFLLARWRARKGRRFCPGPRPPLWKFALPWEWFIAPRCAYDLAGLRMSDAGELTCPECARTLRSLRNAPNHPHRIRWRRLSLVSMTLVWAGLSSPFFRSLVWVKHLPDAVVVLHRIALGSHGFPTIRAEAHSRLSDNKLTPRLTQWLIPALIRDLRDDNVRGNGDTAIDLLGRIGRPAVPALETALDSRDLQQRQLAACILREIASERLNRYHPSDRLLQVTAEGLRADRFPYDHEDQAAHRRSSCTYVFNARDGVDFLTRVGSRAAPMLLAEMRGKDEQARLLAAGVAGFANLEALLPTAAPILIAHIKNNSIEDDAKFAASALFGFGPAVLPFLQPSFDSTDIQERSTARLIALDLITEEDELAFARRATQTISGSYSDPARLAGPSGYGDRIPDLPSSHAGR